MPTEPETSPRLEPNGADPGEEQAALPQPGDLVAAIGLLTVLPLRRPQPGSKACGRATLFFPPVGLLIGAILAGLNWIIAGRLPPWCTAILLIAVWEALIARDHDGGGHVLLTVVAVLTKVAGLTAAVSTRPAALLFAPMLGRWSMVVLATGARDADEPGRKFNPAITFREFALTSVFTLAVVFSVAEAFGMLITVCVAGIVLMLRLLAHRRAGGVTWGLLVASMQGIEAVVVVLCGLL